MVGEHFLASNHAALFADDERGIDALGIDQAFGIGVGDFVFRETHGGIDRQIPLAIGRGVRAECLSGQ